MTLSSTVGTSHTASACATPTAIPIPSRPKQTIAGPFSRNTRAQTNKATSIVQNPPRVSTPAKRWDEVKPQTPKGFFIDKA